VGRIDFMTSHDDVCIGDHMYTHTCTAVHQLFTAVILSSVILIASVKY